MFAEIALNQQISHMVNVTDPSCLQVRVLPELLRLFEQVPEKSVGVPTEDRLVLRNGSMLEELVEGATTASPVGTVTR